MLINETELRIILQEMMNENVVTAAAIFYSDKVNIDNIKSVVEKTVSQFRKKNKRLIDRMVDTRAKSVSKDVTRKDRIALKAAMREIEPAIKVVFSYEDYARKFGKGLIEAKEGVVGAYFPTRSGAFIQNLTNLSTYTKDSEEDIRKMIQDVRKEIGSETRIDFGTIIIGVKEALRMYGPEGGFSPDQTEYKKQLDKFEIDITEGLINEELFHMYDGMVTSAVADLVKEKGGESFSIKKDKSGQYHLDPNLELTEPVSKDMLEKIGIKDVISPALWAQDKKELSKLIARSYSEPMGLTNPTPETVEKNYYDKFLPIFNLMRDYSEMYVGLSEFKNKYGTRDKVDDFFNRHIGKNRGHSSSQLGAKFTALHILVDRSKIKEFKRLLKRLKNY